MRRLLLLGAAAACAVGLVSGETAAMAAPPAPDGALLFRQRCQQCHSLTPARPNKLGPDLRAVVGRKAAMTAFAYSTALKKSGLIWSESNLDRYISGPAKMVPGTKMMVVVPDPAQRRALIGFLAQQR